MIAQEFKVQVRTYKVDVRDYAAVEAARLARLHSKLRRIADADAEGDLPIEDAAGGEQQQNDKGEGESEERVGENGNGGCCSSLSSPWWMMWLGVVDHEEITPEGLERAAVVCRAVG